MHQKAHELGKVLGIAGLVLLGTVATGLAQEPDEPAMKGSMKQECQAMMAARHQMKADMEAASAKLPALVAAMKSAQGDAKMAAIEDTVAELAAQHEKMMSNMMSMQPKMMAHMMRHMQMSMKQGGDEGAMSCPMMQGEEMGMGMAQPSDKQEH